MIFCNNDKCNFRIKVDDDCRVCSQNHIAIGQDGKCITFIEINTANQNCTCGSDSKYYRSSGGCPIHGCNRLGF